MNTFIDDVKTIDFKEKITKEELIELYDQGWRPVLMFKYKKLLSVSWKSDKDSLVFVNRDVPCFSNCHVQRNS